MLKTLNMQESLQGKRVLVTGGTRGVGRATVLALVGAGAHVATCARDAGTGAAALVEDVKRAGGTVHVVEADVTVQADAQRLAAQCADLLGGLDVLVNNAGIDGHRPVTDMSAGDWSAVLDADLTSLFLVTQACLPLLGAGASIVNVGAAAALRGVPGKAHYTAAKAGVLGLTRSLCKELGARGIRVNAVAPGVIATDPDEAAGSPMLDRVRRMTALGRLGEPADVAAAVVYLAGDTAAYVTGAVLNVDGGL